MEQSLEREPCAGPSRDPSGGEEALQAPPSTPSVLPLVWDGASSRRLLGRSRVGLEYEVLAYTSPHFGSTPVQLNILPQTAGATTFHSDVAAARKAAEDHHAACVLSSLLGL